MQEEQAAGYVHCVRSQSKYVDSMRIMVFIWDEIWKEPAHILDVVKQENSRP